MNNNQRINELKKISDYVRTTALGTILNANNGHVGGNLSSVELLVGLYFGGLFKFDPNNSKNENRDRVLIRGHEGPLRYTIFSLLGYIKPDELKEYRQLGSRLQGHEDMFFVPGVDITPSGSLGMVLSYGVGSAIANKDKNIDSKTIVFLGDGEEQEGNISEAARHATNLNLSNLICILDKNGKQLSGATSFYDSGANIEEIWKGYGWDVITVEDGNNIQEVLEAYSKTQNQIKPIMIIANTTKAYGIKNAIEHFNGYHTLSGASKKEKELIIETYKEMKNALEQQGLSYESVSSLAKKLVSTPSNIIIKNNYIDSDVYDIHTNQTGINVEDAQDQFFEELRKNVILSHNKSNIYFITPDLIRKDTEALADFKNFTHFINTGIREQHAIAMAHGISVENCDARIILCCGDAFSYRFMDQLNAAATGKSNILVVGENSGIFQGHNGKTHQTVSQPGALMTIPDVDFYEPADNVDLYNIYSSVLKKNNGLNYVRIHHGTLNIERNDSDKDNIIAYYIHQTDKEPKLVLISTGFMGESAVKVGKDLEINYGIPTNVINMVCPNKFGQKANELLVNDAPIITLYNGSPEILPQHVSSTILSSETLPRPKFIYGHGYYEGTSGTVDDLIKHYQFDEAGIKTMVLKRMNKNR